MRSVKTTTHTFIQEFSTAVWGGITPDPFQLGFRIQPYGDGSLGLGIGEAPFFYWQRGLDSYTQITQIVDQQIGAASINSTSCRRAS